MKRILLALLLLTLSGCTVSGRAYVEHARGPVAAGADLTWKCN